MVTSGFYLDERRQKNDGTFPIKVRIIRDRKVAMVNTGLSCDACDWVNERIEKRGMNSIQKNALLNRWKSEIDGFLMERERNGSLCRMTMKEIVGYVEMIVRGHSKTVRETEFVCVLDDYVERKVTRKSTRDIYISTRTKVHEYEKDIRFEEMTSRWLENFDDWLAKGGMKVNSRGIHMRNIRAVFNFAIDEEITTSYPFRKFKIKKEETEKRSLTVGQLRKLMNCKIEEYQEIYRDMFMLMFYMVGVNAIDLFQAKKEQLEEDRFLYQRAKTGTYYSIKVQPEAMEIINKYKGKGEYMLCVLDTYVNYKDFLHRMNLNLRKMGELKKLGINNQKIRKPYFPSISSYWSRHTWATIAAEIDIPIEVISHALGHKVGSDVTAIYVKFNRMKVDEANRKVIDYVNGKN
jgi:site-specific recombinase XerD